MPSNHFLLCRPLLFLPSSFPSIRVFSRESDLRIRWPKYLSCSFNISPSNEHPGLISFRMDWLDLLAVQGTFKSLLQHHSSKASILWHSAFFIFQLSHPYMTTGKTIALARQTNKWSEVAKSCPTLCDRVDCHLPGSSVHGILQARILEWVANTPPLKKKSINPHSLLLYVKLGGFFLIAYFLLLANPHLMPSTNFSWS